MDGGPLPGGIVPADLTGNHRIEIELAGLPFKETGINKVQNHFSLPTPLVEEEGHRFEEGEGLPQLKVGLVVEEEADTAAKEPGTLFSKEQNRSSRRTDHHLRHCGRILDRTESSHPRMNEYESFLCAI